GIEQTIYYQIFANDISNQVTVENRNAFYYSVYTGSRKAILVGSANDFTGEEPEGAFNSSPDSDFSSWTGNWEYQTDEFTVIHWVGTENVGFEKTGGTGYGSANMTYEWIGNGYTLNNSVEYNITADIFVIQMPPSEGARIGLEWRNSSGIVRTDWSEYAQAGTSTLNITGVSYNETNFEITGLRLILSVSGIFGNGAVVDLDNVKIDKWIAVNSSDPTNEENTSTPPYIDSDGFPAQTLQIYWILKHHGYTDDNIFMMLHHKNDPIIDIYAPWYHMEGTCGPDSNNNLLGAVIDVEDDDVTASRLRLEMNTANGFASEIQPNDQLLIVLTDHGSNTLLGDGNATFHFEADNSFINETEFFDLVKQINCSRMMINIDCCFSGNFIQSSTGVYYNVPNAILVSASSNCASWYWINNQNGDGWAGSWFFNQFWEQLYFGSDITNAFIFAKYFAPFGRINPVGAIQRPLIYDPNNWASTWGFTTDPKL
ncbi:MAG: C13 family peptidase, partial [Promethearchaeota archaeon]